MIKKYLLALISVFTVVCLLTTSAFAAGYTFKLTADGDTEIFAAQDQEITVKLFLINNGAEEDTNYDLYSMQDYVCFDRSFFEFVPGSIQVFRYSSAGQAVNLFGASALSFDGGAKDRVFVNRGSTSPHSVNQTLEVLSFKLKVLASSGSSTITHDTVEMLAADGTRLAYDTQETVVTVGVPQFTITATASAGGTISPAGATTVTKGESKTYTITANSGYQINKVLVDGESKGAISTYTFENITKNHEIEAVFDLISGASTGGTIVVNPSTPPVDEDDDDDFAEAEVMVDDKALKIASTTVSDGTTEVVIDHEQLKKEISKETQNVAINVDTKSNSVITKLTVADIQNMATNDASLIINTSIASYILPSNVIDIDQIKGEFDGVDLDKIPFEVTLNRVADTEKAAVVDAVKDSGSQVVGSVIEFSTKAVHNGKTVAIKKFNDFVVKEIEITKDQANKVQTAVVYEENGSLRHVPTYIHQENGKYYARIYSLTNSTYALIEGEKSFADANGMWFESTVNEMASRKIVNGRTDTTFDGDAAITRAEFAAIIVRALGLPSDGTVDFTDVVASDWFMGAVGKAQEYGIVSGKGEGKFEPNALITREEAMTMIARAAKITGLPEGTPQDLESFVDSDLISDWAKEYVKFNVDNSLIVGNEAKELAPNATITRAETATVILRLLRNAELVDIR